LGEDNAVVTPSSRPAVLVVEDDRATSDLLREIVDSLGFRFIPATEGHLAVTIAVEEQPRIITLDLGLPDTDGHAVLHRLLSDQRTRSIPIVIVTAYRRYLPAHDHERLAAVFEKPFDLDELAGVLRQLVTMPAEVGVGRSPR
jgi:CheY-like chemotaxis protein